MWHYKEDILHIESTPVPKIAAEAGTPIYVYSLQEIERRVHAYQQAFPSALLAYACKANAHPRILAHLASLGCGADVVSLGELTRALDAGIPPEHIVVNGNAKTDEEIARALKAGVLALNLDAVEEIPRVEAIAQELGVIARVALRINPGLDLHTHPHLRVGAVGSHFGIPSDDVLHAANMIATSPYLQLQGIHLHIGSQLTQLEELQPTARLAAYWVRTLREHGYEVQHINLGGGLGISYEGGPELTPTDLAAAWHPHLEELNVHLIVEPGRWIVAHAGILVVRVVQVKRAWGRTFVAVNAGMNALLRPALYGARHRIVPVVRRPGEIRTDVVGPNCESADVLGRDYLLPPLEPGDLLAILDVGAYGRSMANTYNLRPIPREIIIS